MFAALASKLGAYIAVAVLIGSLLLTIYVQHTRIAMYKAEVATQVANVAALHGQLTVQNAAVESEKKVADSAEAAAVAAAKRADVVHEKVVIQRVRVADSCHDAVAVARRDALVLNGLRNRTAD